MLGKASQSQAKLSCSSSAGLRRCRVGGSTAPRFLASPSSPSGPWRWARPPYSPHPPPQLRPLLEGGNLTGQAGNGWRGSLVFKYAQMSSTHKTKTKSNLSQAFILVSHGVTIHSVSVGGFCSDDAVMTLWWHCDGVLVGFLTQQRVDVSLGVVERCLCPHRPGRGCQPGEGRHATVLRGDKAWKERDCVGGK